MLPLMAQDIMARGVVSVFPETPLTNAARTLAKHHFDGVPVVDKEHKLVGILTEYDLISKASAIHLPTFQKILQELPLHKEDSVEFQNDFQELLSLTAGDIMNQNPLTLVPHATFEEVVAAFRDHHRVNPIPVIDKDRKVVVVISRFYVFQPLELLSSLSLNKHA